MNITRTRTVLKPMLTDKHYLFNDKLADGRRSVKVWGWTERDYDKAKVELEKAGLKVEVVDLYSYKYGSNFHTRRLHVTE